MGAVLVLMAALTALGAVVAMFSLSFSAAWQFLVAAAVLGWMADMHGRAVRMVALLERLAGVRPGVGTFMAPLVAQPPPRPASSMTLAERLAEEERGG